MPPIPDRDTIVKSARECPTQCTVAMVSWLMPEMPKARLSISALSAAELFKKAWRVEKKEKILFWSEKG
jgi:hypothetical protein